MPETPSIDQLRARRSVKWQQHPDDVLPMWVAEMDYALAPPVARALHDAVDRSDTGYAHLSPGLLQAVADFTRQRWGWTVGPDDVRVAPDVGVAAVEVLRVLLRGRPVGARAVVTSPPVYPPFTTWVAEAGGELVTAPLRHTADTAREERPQDGEKGAPGWRLDLEAIERTFVDRPVAYLLCHPHNPVGRVHDAAELRALAELAQRYDVTVVADEIHAPLALPGVALTPFLALGATARSVGITLTSASKAWNLAGLKCAFVITQAAGPAAVAAALPVELEARAGHLGLIAAEVALTEGVPWLDALLPVLADRHAQLAERLRVHAPWVGTDPTQAGYLAWLDLRALRADSGVDPATELLERARLAVVPGPDFGAGGAGWVRLNVGCAPELVDEAVRRLATLRS